MFIEDLPRKNNSKHIDWDKCIGYNVKFIYEDINGYLPILNITRKNRHICIVTEYDNIKNYCIEAKGFSNCTIGELLNTNNHNHKYKYEIGTIIKINTGKIKILDQIRVPNGNRQGKGYKYKCLVCGNIDNISEFNLNSSQGCGVCSGKKVLKGYNDLWTTHPEIARMLKFPEIGYKVSHGSNKKQIFVCKDCGFEKSISLCGLIRAGFGCPKCSDSVSYPEKFIFNILTQLGIEFQTQLSKTTFGWCKDYRYDFYIPSINGILEANGSQHYSQSARGRKLEEEQLNDKIKKNLAIKSGTKKYIVIDCRKSNLEFIKNNILNSELNCLFDLSKIDWENCHKCACNSLVKIACDIWKNGINDTVEISEILKLCEDTIIKYLNQGTQLRWCNYNTEEEIAKRSHKKGDHNRKKVICITTDTPYNSISEASRLLDINKSSIGGCCVGRHKSAGKSKTTGEKLRWMYYDEYLKLA